MKTAVVITSVSTYIESKNSAQEVSCLHIFTVTKREKHKG